MLGAVQTAPFALSIYMVWLSGRKPPSSGGASCFLLTGGLFPVMMKETNVFFSFGTVYML